MMGYVLAFLLGMICMGFLVRTILALTNDNPYL